MAAKEKSKKILKLLINHISIKDMFEDTKTIWLHYKISAIFGEHLELIWFYHIIQFC